MAQETTVSKVTDMQNDQEDLQREQQDLKEHTLKRLDALDEKMEWFLSKGQQGAHPLSDWMSQLEGQLYDRTTSIEQQLTPLGSHMEQQQTRLTRVGNQLEQQQRHLTRLGNIIDGQQESTRKVEDVGTLKFS